VKPYDIKPYAVLLAFFLLAMLAGAAQAEETTIVVSAEGLADPQADTYKRDRGLMIEDLRKDARRQVVEKAVGTLVESSTLVENYELIEDRVMTRSAGLIKRVIEESDPWIGEDGFAHMLVKAEVYLGNVRDALESMSRESRIGLIKQRGNPRIAVSVVVRDALRNAPEERSDIAENILKEHIKAYGYRVWSEDGSTNAGSRVPSAADFRIQGKAKFQRIDLTLQASGLRVSKYKLTSWSVKCIDASTGEEIYFNNQIPRHKTWSSEDEALGDIGQLIGNEFSQDFFEQHLMVPTRIYQLQVAGLPDYDSAKLLEQEMIGLRSVLNVDLRNFDANGRSLMEVEFSGSNDNFSDLISSAVIKPLNAKAGADVFKLVALNGNSVELAYKGEMNGEELGQRFSTTPPASLVDASPQRIAQIVRSEEAAGKVESLRSLAWQR
jgi:serine/threonine-protein kinase